MYLFGGIFILVFSLAFMVNIMCTMLNATAYKYHSILYSYICAKNTRISCKNRLKLMAFMERLSAKDIGFYCYDMFLMNNYEFMQYVIGFISNHILLLNLLN